MKKLPASVTARATMEEKPSGEPLMYRGFLNEDTIGRNGIRVA
jgi:hypothetical protein